MDLELKDKVILILSDATNIQRALIVPLVCYFYILSFALRRHEA
jgi:fucose permease